MELPPKKRQKVSPYNIDAAIKTEWETQITIWQTELSHLTTSHKHNTRISNIGRITDLQNRIENANDIIARKSYKPPIDTGLFLQDFIAKVSLESLAVYPLLTSTDIDTVDIQKELIESVNHFENKLIHEPLNLSTAEIPLVFVTESKGHSSLLFFSGIVDTGERKATERRLFSMGLVQGDVPEHKALLHRSAQAIPALEGMFSGVSLSSPDDTHNIFSGKKNSKGELYKYNIKAVQPVTMTILTNIRNWITISKGHIEYASVPWDMPDINKGRSTGLARVDSSTGYEIQGIYLNPPVSYGIASFEILQSITGWNCASWITNIVPGVKSQMPSLRETYKDLTGKDPVGALEKFVCNPIMLRGKTKVDKPLLDTIEKLMMTEDKGSGIKLLKLLENDEKHHFVFGSYGGKSKKKKRISAAKSKKKRISAAKSKKKRIVKY